MTIGLIIMGLIIIPLFVLMIASVLEKPRSIKVAGMFTTVFIIQIVGMVLGMVAFGYIMGFIVPG